MIKARSSRFVMGKQTRSFDVLEEDLIVVQFDKPVSEGVVLEVVGTKGPDQLAYQPLTPFKVPQEGSDKGFKAFKPNREGFFLCDGIEWVPRRIKRYVRYTQTEGFQPVDRDTVTAELTRKSIERSAQSSGSRTWPPLQGTTAQIAYASKLRLAAFKHVSGSPELESKLLAHTSSSWFIKRKAYTRDQWIQTLTHSPASN